MLSKLRYLLSKALKKVLNIPAVKGSLIDKTSRVCSGSNVINSTVDKYSYVGNYSTVIECNIGKFCSIADNCIIGGATHPIEWASTSPVFHHGKNIMKTNFAEHQYELFKRTKIGNDVWIGNNALIKGGVTIGDGAIIGMGSVVTKDVEPYTIVAGNPAKFIRYRFDKNTIVKLQDIKWWEWNLNKIEENSHLFNDVEKFTKSMK